MSSGKVEISIEKWEEVRNENVELKRSVEDLSGKQSIVKIVLIDKDLNFNVKYDRWREKNVLIDKTKTIESIEYMGLDHIKDILDKEAKDTVIKDLETKDKTIKSLKEKIDKNIIKHNNGLTAIKEQHKLFVAGIQSDKDKLIKQVAELQSKSKETELNEKILQLESDKAELIVTVNKMDIKIDNLEKTNTALFKRIPWWRRNA